MISYGVKQINEEGFAMRNTNLVSRIPSPCASIHAKASCAFVTPFCFAIFSTAATSFMLCSKCSEKRGRCFLKSAKIK